MKHGGKDVEKEEKWRQGRHIEDSLARLGFERC